MHRFLLCGILLYRWGHNLGVFGVCRWNLQHFNSKNHSLYRLLSCGPVRHWQLYLVNLHWALRCREVWHWWINFLNMYRFLLCGILLHWWGHNLGVFGVCRWNLQHFNSKNHSLHRLLSCGQVWHRRFFDIGLQRRLQRRDILKFNRKNHCLH
jgi:hypothetical protein